MHLGRNPVRLVSPWRLMLLLRSVVQVAAECHYGEACGLGCRCLSVGPVQCVNTDTELLEKVQTGTEDDQRIPAEQFEGPPIATDVGLQLAHKTMNLLPHEVQDAACLIREQRRAHSIGRYGGGANGTGVVQPSR